MSRRPVPKGQEEHFTHHAFPKKAYTQVEAQRQAARYKQVAYVCRVCGAWHLASSSRDVKR